MMHCAYNSTLVLIYVISRAESRAIVRPVRFSQRKLPMTVPVIETTTLRLVGQYLNQPNHRVPRNYTSSL